MITRTNGLLTGQSIKHLSQLLGQDVFGLHTKSVNIRPDSYYIEFSDLAFALHDKKKFVTVRPIWEEDIDGEDYGWLETTIEDSYGNITFDHLRRTTDVYSIISLTPASPVQRITALSGNLFLSDTTAGETWPYHFGLLFEHKERFKYLIFYRPEAYCRLQFTFNEDEIEYLLKKAETKDIIENSL